MAMLTHTHTAYTEDMDMATPTMEVTTELLTDTHSTVENTTNLLHIKNQNFIFFIFIMYILDLRSFHQ